MASYVVIADDEPFITRSLAFVLERAGYTCRSFRSGNDALAEVREDVSAVGIIITDTRMPREGDGLALASGARDAGYRGPILALGTTGPGATADREGMAALQGDFMTKPFSPSRVVEYVNEKLRPEAR